jgi:hypothetical protein
VCFFIELWAIIHSKRQTRLGTTSHYTNWQQERQFSRPYRRNESRTSSIGTDYLGSDQFAKDMVAAPMDNTPARNVWDEFDSLTYIQQLGKKAQTQLNNASVYAPIPDIVCPPQQSSAWLTGGQQILIGKDPKSILQNVEEARQEDIEKYS